MKTAYTSAYCFRLQETLILLSEVTIRLTLIKLISGAGHEQHFQRFSCITEYRNLRGSPPYFCGSDVQRAGKPRTLRAVDASTHRSHHLQEPPYCCGGDRCRGRNRADDGAAFFPYARRHRRPDIAQEAIVSTHVRLADSCHPRNAYLDDSLYRDGWLGSVRQNNR